MGGFKRLKHFIDHNYSSGFFFFLLDHISRRLIYTSYISGASPATYLHVQHHFTFVFAAQMPGCLQEPAAFLSLLSLAAAVGAP